MAGTLFLVDGIWTGHHPTYVKLFAATFLELGYGVTVLCPRPDEVAAWIGVQRPGDLDRFRAFTYVDPEFHPRLPGLLRAAGRWRLTAAAVKRAGSGVLPDLVFFAHLDAYFAARLPGWLVDRLFPARWSGLYFGPERLRAPQHGAVRRDGALGAAGCRSVALLDEGVAACLARELGGRPVVPFPDVADLSPPDRSYPLRQEMTSRAAGRRIVGLFGCIDKRKGTLTLLETAEQLANEPFFFVLAGVFYRQTFSSEELARLDRFVASRPENCLLHFGFIPDEAAFNALVEGCDIIYAAYHDFRHSSNLLTKAAFFRKPVIVSDGYCMAERVRRHNLGEVVADEGVSACIDAIRAAAGGRHWEPDADGYLQQHSLEALKQAAAELLRHSVTG